MNIRLLKITAAASGLLLATLVAAAPADDVVRLPLPDGNRFPISSAVTVRGDLDTVYVSGALPSVANKDAAKGSVASYGDTEAQTVSTLNNIKATLARLGLGLGDIVKMTVLLVGDPAKENKMDFAGLMKGYSQFFGTAEQPSKPARSAMQVVALALPGALVEIEVIAVKPR